LVDLDGNNEVVLVFFKYPLHVIQNIASYVRFSSSGRGRVEFFTRWICTHPKIGYNAQQNNQKYKRIKCHHTLFHNEQIFSSKGVACVYVSFTHKTVAFCPFDILHRSIGNHCISTRIDVQERPRYETMGDGHRREHQHIFSRIHVPCDWTVVILCGSVLGDDICGVKLKDSFLFSSNMSLGNQWIWNQVHDHIYKDYTGPLSKDSCVFVLGSSSIGKTFKVNEICSGCSITYIHSHNCSNAKEFRDIFIKGTCTSLMNHITNTNSKRIILIDELETLMHMDRSIFTCLVDLIANKTLSIAHVPVICIGNASLDKKIATAFACKVYTCSAPCVEDIFLWLKQTYHHIPVSRLYEIAELCDGNLNRALHFLNDLQTVAADKSENDKAYEFGCVFSDPNIHGIRSVFADDPWLQPLRFHENVPKDLAQRRGGNSEKELLYRHILSHMCNWDGFMTSHKDDEYDIPIEYISHVALLIHKLKPKKTKDTENLSDFTKLFSNLSLQKKQERVTYASNSEFPWNYAQIFCDYVRYK